MKARSRGLKPERSKPGWPRLLLPLFFFPLGFSFLDGCGYQWLGRAAPAGSEVRRIAVPTWINRTDIRGIEAVFTRRLIEAIEKRGLARVVPRGEAEAVLEGKIHGVSFAAASFQEGGSAPVDYQLRVAVGVRLIDTRDGKVIWEIPSLVEAGYYDARAEPLKQESGRGDALARAAEAISEEIADRWGGQW